jgi:hypothetical protein
MIRHFPTLQAAISALTQTGFVEVGIVVYMNGSAMATIHPVLGSSIVMVAYSER